LDLTTALEELNHNLETIGGCTNGNCQVIPPKGMHTNGGCKCLKDYITAQKVVWAYKEFVKDIVTRYMSKA
jgi:hypothetical protein